MQVDKITLLLGADSLLGNRSGVGRMTLEISEHLQDNADISRYGLLVDGAVLPPEWTKTLTDGAGVDALRSPRSRFSSLQRLPVRNIAAVRAAYTYVRRSKLNKAIRALSENKSPVLYHEPNMITTPYDGPTVATFNDLSWHWDPALHPSERLRWIEGNLSRVIEDSSRFVAISSFTANEMVRELGIARERIDVVPLAASTAFRPISAQTAAPILKSFNLEDQNYILSVSTLEPRKNFDRLLASYLALPQNLRSKTPLVIVGGKGWGEVLKSADRAIASGELRLLGHVPDAALAALTARCAAYVYISLYEGFGLPILEAMSAGAPVIASSTTASGETCGDGAVLVNPMDEFDIRRHLLTMLEEPAVRQRWKQAGLRRSLDFSWPKTVNFLVSSWHKALGHSIPSLEARHELIAS